MLDTLRPLLYFDTVKLVTVHSVKIGAMHRTLQVLVLLYIIIYSIVLKKGYREFSPVDGVVYTKVKGVGYTNSTTDFRIYDANDLVVPPIEADAIFITTALSSLYQTLGNCSSTVPCTRDSNCTGNFTSVGKIIGICNETSGFCTIEGWCPLEVDTSPDVLLGLESITIFMRSSIEYTTFGIEKADPNTPVAGRNLFTLLDVLNGTQISQCTAGCIITATIDWDCNLDTSPCGPLVLFTMNPGGFNYRTAEYDMSHTNRRLEKLFGVRILIQITGQGARFSFFVMIITMGSGAAFFAVATLVVDLFLLFVFRNSQFEETKFSHYELPPESE